MARGKFMQITKVCAREILDSRANPTIETEVTLSCGISCTASVPAGASRGSHEAHELRDNDSFRYNGQGVLAAVSAVNDIIAPALVGTNVADNISHDSIMIALDGCTNKSNLGANAILSVSFALARAAAAALGIPLYKYIGGPYATRLPVPMMNILNGGAHSTNNVDIQEFMILPVGAASFSDAVRVGSEVYKSLKKLLDKKGLSTGVGDEGGFAPMLNSDKEAISLICEAIDIAGYKVGDDVALGLDVASSEWYSNGKYRLPKRDITMEREELCAYIEELVREFPIISVEDGMAEDDISGWQLLTERLAEKKTLLVGDDLFVTNSERINLGKEKKIANAVLIKPNQIGTLTETAEAIKCAVANGYKTIMSHRSGETEDSIIADLAVGFGTHFIKTGAPARSERVAKYNRLMKIESEIFCSEYGF